MCKELLETAGKGLDYQTHIEYQGRQGPKYVLTEQEIKEADVILATDDAIDLERLTEVPDKLPPDMTSLYEMFSSTSKFNQDISK
uniref:Uncharacterized protein n=1 Tax=Eufriesea mexicana TaxID=516756 RepID=A0A310S675_9HYME